MADVDDLVRHNDVAASIDRRLEIVAHRLCAPAGRRHRTGVRADERNLPVGRRRDRLLQGFEFTNLPAKFVEPIGLPCRAAPCRAVLGPFSLRYSTEMKRMVCIFTVFEQRTQPANTVIALISTVSGKNPLLRNHRPRECDVRLLSGRGRNPRRQLRV